MAKRKLDEKDFAHESDDDDRPCKMVTNADLLNCQKGNGLWMCPSPGCNKVLSRKQTLRSHVTTCHGFSFEVACVTSEAVPKAVENDSPDMPGEKWLACGTNDLGETEPRRYKMYEVDNSISMPRSTYFLKKRQSMQIEYPSTVEPCSSDIQTVDEIPESANLENEEEWNDSGYHNVQDNVEPICIKSSAIYDNSDMDISSDNTGDSSATEDSDEENIETGITTNYDDPPLYVLQNGSQLYGSSITRSEHHLAVSAFACRHNLSDTGVKHLLDMIQLHLPQNNIGETRVTKIKELCGFDDTYLQYHFYCGFCNKLFTEGVGTCKTPGCTGQQSDGNCKRYFVTSSLDVQLREVLQRDGIWKAIQDGRLHSKTTNGQLSDVKCGSVYKKLLEPDGFLHSSNNITFSLFTDGVPLFKSSGVSIWPVYLLINEILPKERFQRKNMLLWGVWQGTGKPNMNMFLKPLVFDLCELYNIGIDITVSGECLRVKAMLILATMDLPARASVVNMTQHNGMNGCLYCMEPGKTVPSGNGHCRIYPVREEQPLKRTDEGIKRSARAARLTGKRTDGFFGESVLLYLPYFSLTNFVAIDYMHGILLGITKLFLDLWFNAKYQTEPYNISHHITAVDTHLRKIHPPYMIHRHPRILSKTYHHWKASELRNWLLFYSIPCLRGYIPDVYLTHFSCLVEGTYLLLGEGISREDVSRADMLFNAFVTNIKNLYPIRIMGINVHNLTHIIDCVKKFGPLWGVSCFAFESFNGELKRSIHGTGNVCRQMFWVLQAQKRVEQKVVSIADGDGKRFLKSMLGETTRLSWRLEAYQCYVGKLKPVTMCFSAELKLALHNAIGEYDIGQMRTASKISRNGFLMYSCSSKKTRKQNSYTIALETSSRESRSAIEVDFYLVILGSMKVFAVGKLMESTETILPQRVPHLRIFHIRTDQTAVKAERLWEPLVVVKKDDHVCAAHLPNQFERD